MGELVTRGFLGGHAPTKGFYSTEAEQEEIFLSELEALIGLNPLVRVKISPSSAEFPFIYELEKLKAVSNVNRAVEYVFGKPRFGSCQFIVDNGDKRWSDFYDRSKTYLFSTDASVRSYFARRAVVELGFDNIHKHKDSYWFPIFTGYIYEKEESGDDQRVQVQLMDEWLQLLDYQLAPVVVASDFINYDVPTTEDNRLLQLGTYFGRHAFLKKEYTSKTNQLLIPCAVNIAGAQHGRPAYTVFSPTFESPVIMKDWMDISNVKVYVWDWRNPTTKQWLLMPQTNDDTSTVWQMGGGTVDDRKILLFKSLSSVINFKNVLGVNVDMPFEDLLDTTSKDYDLDIRIEATALEDNPVKILYYLLKDAIGIAAADIDASINDPDNWIDNDYDFDDPLYYSFDVSATYLGNQSTKVCVNATKDTKIIDLINSFCALTRGSFFIDKGKNKVDGIPTRRVRFVIHQPRRTYSALKVLTGERIRDVKLSRARNEIRNNIIVSSFNYDVDENKFNEQVIVNRYDNTSIGLYGERTEQINFTTQSIAFLYECAAYATFLAEHILLQYKEPPPRLEFRTDLIGCNFDLKSLVGIRETQLSLDTNLEENIANGVFEMYNLNFNTQTFMFTFGAQWAGFLIFPDGDATKRWAFADSAYTDADADGIEYYCW